MGVSRVQALLWMSQCRYQSKIPSLHRCPPKNALLWGCEAWSISKKNIKKTSELPSHFHQEITKDRVEPSQRTVNKELMSKKPLLQYTKHQSIHSKEKCPLHWQGYQLSWLYTSETFFWSVYIKIQEDWTTTTVLYFSRNLQKILPEHVKSREGVLKKWLRIAKDEPQQKMNCSGNRLSKSFLKNAKKNQRRKTRKE